MIMSQELWHIHTLRQSPQRKQEMMPKYEDEIREVLRRCGVGDDANQGTNHAIKDNPLSMLRDILVKDLDIEPNEVDLLLRSLKHDTRAMLALSRVLQALLKNILQI